MDPSAFRFTRAIRAALSALGANALVVALLGAILVAAPLWAQLHFHPPTGVSMKVTLPPPPERTAHTEDVGFRSAGSLRPVRMFLDATQFVWAAVTIPLGAVFDGFIVIATLDHSAGRARPQRERLIVSLRNLWALLIIGVFTLIAVTLGMMLFLFPSIFVVAGLAAAGPIRLMEGLGPFAAIARSIRLGWGQLGKMSLAGLACIAAQLAFVIFSPTDDAKAIVPLNFQTAITAGLVAAALRSVSAAMSAGLYIELTRKEFGAAITHLEGVFN